jgi:hypothetical protein
MERAKEEWYSGILTKRDLPAWSSGLNLRESRQPGLMIARRTSGATAQCVPARYRNQLSREGGATLWLLGGEAFRYE